MLNEPKFLKCVTCDTLVECLNPQCCDELMCCGVQMELLKPNQLISLEEKHLPVVKREGDMLTVCVGRVLHPMSSEHNILWVEVKSKYAVQRINLKKGDDPIAIFHVAEEEPVLVYAYCNLHGLWKVSA
ncbi:MAG: desulfoferrodoxin [Clostridia bacterium]|nr:desulfoferrodoxin [Clostridia bacterium]